MAFFEKVKYSTKRTYTNVEISKIQSIADLKKIPRKPRFYIIFSNYTLRENKCTCFLNDSNKNYPAIYRGQGYNVRERIKSHLFNKKYNGSFTICLDLDGEKGINIDTDARNNGYSWFIAFHGMTTTNGNTEEFIRIQAEIAFDNYFTKPVGSKDITRRFKTMQ
ncbi:hypothetical protein QFZ77_000009 [Paenibacillus sp. V4I3]|uniref:hypothetical protein n=1 Tax=Paenibacillus sp. V4I3 TaxID=3042305 RepID=UPI002785EB00|nr:hypothetical protein [Paenibacillus sp. V4I3]MDQ0871350.1 hypothetical protein [Paenibacillus sp. V4I3]